MLNLLSQLPEDVRDHLLEGLQIAKEWTLPNGEKAETSRPIDVTNVAVIGGGTMGARIAIAARLAGYKTTLVEANEQALEAYKKRMAEIVTREHQLKRLSGSQVRQLSAIRPVTRLEEIADADLIIEAVVEDMRVKCELWKKLEAVVKPTAVFATNTSSLDIDQMASGLSRPDRLAGMHFFNPANVLPILEMVHGKLCSGTTFATLFAVGEKMQKVCIAADNIPGFCFNRMLFAYVGQAERAVLMHDFTPSDVDAVARRIGLKMGPFTMLDMNGLDVGGLVAKAHGWSTSPLVDTLIKGGRFGRKTNAGYYDYDPVTARKSVSYGFEQLTSAVRREARAKCTERPLTGEQDLVLYLLTPFINEGYECVSRGTVAHEVLVDLFFILGFGWPPQTGGPLYWARQIGLHRFAQTIEELHRNDPQHIAYTPSSLLIQEALPKALY